MGASSSKPRRGCIPVPSGLKWWTKRKRQRPASSGRGFWTALSRCCRLSLLEDHAKNSEQAYVSSKTSKETNSRLSSTPSGCANGTLCRGCQAIIPNDSTLSNSISGTTLLRHGFLMPTPHFKRRTISSIKDTARSGCQLCKHMEAAIQKSSRYGLACKDVAENTTVESFNYLVVEGLQGLVVDFHSFQEDEISERFNLTFPISAYPGPCRDRLGINQRPPFENILSKDEPRLAPEVQNRLQEWIATCIGQCDKKTSPTILPKRLLDVRNVREQSRIILRETASLEKQETTPYAALSHCWGTSGKPPMKTTHDSLAGMNEGIGFDELSSCYQDAVIVCRSLDIRYLWIDSLCINQDDMKEWEEESQVVARIYQEALITIIPSASESCNDSFLRRSLPRAETVEINFESSITKPPMRGSFFIDQPNSSNCSGLSLFDQDTTKSKWGSRGWTFSEKLFSTRRIYFGKNAIHWSCGGFYSSEIQHGYEEAVEYNLGTRIDERLKTGENIFSIWYDHILDYSSRSLTFEADRLPAISALAKVVSETTGDNFLAGIWRSDMQNGLLWCATEFRSPIALPATPGYVAPSWSWLARAQNAEIKHLSSQKALIPEIRETKIDMAGANPFGRVQGGHMTMSGPVYTLTKEEFWKPTGRIWSIYHEIVLKLLCKAECFLDKDLHSDSHQNEFQRPGVSISNAEEFVLLPIRKGCCLERTTSRGSSEDSGTCGEDAPISGLVLIPSGRKSPNQYCRAGIFEVIGPRP